MTTEPGTDSRLTAAQLDRINRYGSRRSVGAGEVLFRPGQATEDFFVVESGTVEIERPATPDAQAVVLSSQGAGAFLGELNLLTGQATYLTARVSSDGVVTVLEGSAFRRLMQEDAEISDLVLRTFMARRRFLRTSEGARTVEILGSRWCSDSTALRSWAARQQLPHLWVDVDTEEGVALSTAVGATVLDLPLVIALGRVERRASPARLAALVGLEVHHDAAAPLRDLVVLGAGPAGLAAALCGASEGLDTLLVEGRAVGGQAAASARIENYVGFPSGIAGGELTSRAMVQAHKFGATVASPCAATTLTTAGGHLEVTLADGSRVLTRSAVVATGAQYTTLPLPGWERFEATSIFYAATDLEARVCTPAPVVVVGGANSAGQAAIFLADAGSSVTLVVRGAELGVRMSRYLVGRVEAHPGIAVRTRTAVTALHGNGSLEAVTLTDGQRHSTTVGCAGLFCFIGATPATDFLPHAARDPHGFLRTDRDLPAEDLGVEWELLGRRPLPYETNVPGLFAVGDVRAGSVKRVAAAVGEGSSAIASVHAVLTSAGHSLRRQLPA